MSKEHDSLLTIHPFAVIAGADPGAIGKRKGWLDTSATPPILKYRNEANNAWAVVVDAEALSEDIAAVDDDITTVSGDLAALSASLDSTNFEVNAVNDRVEDLEILYSNTGVQIIAHELWSLDVDEQVILNCPVGKNAILDSIILISPNAVDKGMSGATLSIIDDVGEFDLLDFLGTTGEWNKFNSGLGLNTAGASVKFKGRWDHTTGNYRDFPLISDGITIHNSTTGASFVHVFVIGTFIDAIYI